MVDGNLWLKRVRWSISVVITLRVRILRGTRIAILGCATCVLATGCATPSAYQIPPETNLSSLDKVLSVSHFEPPERAELDLLKSSGKAELIIPEHRAVNAWVERYTGKQRRSFEATLERARHYVVPMQRIFVEKGLPGDLVFLALVESGFSPTARSPANAVGMHQFIAATGKRFGLEHTRWVDERRHPLKSARAAAEYLSFLYDMFNSWPLALAAYNCGENAVQDAIKRSGLKTYWELIEKGYLPKETRQFVPKILAAVRILRRPDRYGLDYDRGQWNPLCETVSVPSGLSLAWLSKRAGIPLAVLKKCNPELCTVKTPADQSQYGLCVPTGKGEIVAALAGSGDTSKKPAMMAHKVNPGDTLYAIAKRYGISVAALAAENRMKPSQPLKIGQLLTVTARTAIMAKKDRQNGTSSTRNEISAHSARVCRSGFYQVRPSDSLWTIAQRFGVPLEQLRSHNGISRAETLRSGDSLRICGITAYSGS